MRVGGESAQTGRDFKENSFLHISENLLKNDRLETEVDMKL